MTADEIARLRKIAERSTQGKWSHEPHGDTTALYSDRSRQEHGLRLLNLDDGDKNFVANATHITTFDPPTVLSLLTSLEQSQAAFAEAHDDAIRLHKDKMDRVEECFVLRERLDAATRAVDACRDALDIWQSRDPSPDAVVPARRSARAAIAEMEGK